MCDHLQMAYDGKVRKLLLNLPPRTGKSNVMCVFFPAWCWAKEPNLRFLYTSYAQTLSVRDSVGCRRLILSEWYQSLWGDKFRLMTDVNNKLRFDNDHSGYRITSSVGGTNTGHGGDFVFCFPYETLIRTDDGDWAIGDIVEYALQVKVASYNHQNNKIEYKPLLNRLRNFTQVLINIEFDDGSVLTCTEDHPIFSQERGYIPAKELTVGDKCLYFGT